MNKVAGSAEITALLEQAQLAWGRRDFLALKGLWDTAADPLYLPEEAREVCGSWPELDAYWGATQAASARIAVKIRALLLRELTNDLVAAFYTMDWSFATRAPGAPVAGETRVYAVFRRTASGWRFAQYIEAPLAPIVYMRMLYERQVDPGFLTS
jgi:hypothetical protein